MAYTNEQLGKALEDLTIAYNNFIEKAKEAAIAAMKDTVVAQIKQDAKEYIAAELATQKDALIQAIEHAKIALRNSAIEADDKLKQSVIEKKNELQSLITIAENTLKEKTDEAAQNINAAVLNAEKNLNTATKKIINRAKLDLSEMGLGIALSIRHEMTSLLAGIEARLMGRINDTENRLMSKNEEVRTNIWSGVNRIVSDHYMFFYTNNVNIFNITYKKDTLWEGDADVVMRLESRENLPIKNRAGNVSTTFQYNNQQVHALDFFKISEQEQGSDIYKTYMIYGVNIQEIYLIERNNYRFCEFHVYIDSFPLLKKVEADSSRFTKHITNCPNYKP